MQNAITTAELFRLLSLSIGREKEATPYMVAKVFGISPGAATAWKKGWSVMDETNAEKAADMLGLDLEFVIFSLEAERRTRSGMARMAAIFERAALAAQGHAGRAVAGFVALAILAAPALSYFDQCILCKIGSDFFKARRSSPRRPRPLPSSRPLLITV